MRDFTHMGEIPHPLFARFSVNNKKSPGFPELSLMKKLQCRPDYFRMITFLTLEFSSLLNLKK